MNLLPMITEPLELKCENIYLQKNEENLQFEFPATDGLAPGGEDFWCVAPSCCQRPYRFSCFPKSCIRRRPNFRKRNRQLRWRSLIRKRRSEYATMAKVSKVSCNLFLADVHVRSKAHSVLSIQICLTPVGINAENLFHPSAHCLAALLCQ